MATSSFKGRWWGPITRRQPVGAALGIFLQTPGRTWCRLTAGSSAGHKMDSSASVSLLSQTITLEPATVYVFSGYLWNMGNSTNHVKREHGP